MANRFLNNIRINDEYTLPSSDGTENQIIVTDGAGNLSFNDLGTITGAVNGVESNLIYYEVKNSSGSQILKGKGVMAVGTDGNSGHILIDEMVADGSVEARYFLGVLSETLNNGDIGRVIAFGELDQFNTNGQNGETWSDGQVLWCDPDSAGDFTITEPEGPNVKIPAAFILKASTNGKIQVRVQANEGIHQLHDTKITSQVDGELLVWNNTLGVWQNDGTATIDYTNGRVGIGTTSPSSKLDVNGNTNITGTLNVTDGTDSVEMYYAGIIYKRNTSYLRPDGNGTRSLFIGGPSQSSADWNNVYVYTNGSNDFKWNDEVVATQTWVETNFAELVGDNIAYTNVDNNFSVNQTITKSNATLSVVESGGADTKLRSGSVGVVGTYNDADFRILRNTNTIIEVLTTGVDITGKLGVSSNINLQNNTSVIGLNSTGSETGQIIGSTGSNGLVVGQSARWAGGTNIYSGGVGVTLEMDSSKNSTFNGKVTVNSEIESDTVRIKSNFSGGVGIILDRTENASVDSLFHVGVSHNGTTTSDFIWMGTSTSDFSISGTGNVGIGTTSPGHLLEIRGTSDALSVGDDSNTQTYMRFANSRTMVGYSGSDAVLQGGSGKGIRFNTNNDSFNSGTVMYINSSGNVGIGTTSPHSEVKTHISADTTAPNLSGITPVDATLMLSNLDTAYGTMFATDGAGKGYIQQRRTNTNTFYDLLLNPYGGNVGIGTTNPAYLLDVQGAAKFASPIHIGSVTNALASGSGDLFLSSGRLTIASNDNVGIGSASPVGKLEVHTGSSGAFFTRTAGDNGTVNPALALQTSSGDTRIGSSGKLAFLVGAVGTAVNVQPEVVTIATDGNVGIGATSPSEKLEVVGEIKANAGNDEGFILNGNNGFLRHNGTGAKIRTNGLDALIIDNSQNTAIQGSGSTVFDFSVGRDLSVSGEVGIGTTNPAYKLEVSGNAALSIGGDRYLRIGSSTNYWWDLQSVSNDFTIKEAGSNTRVIVKAGGNVGIGTTNPGSRLTVSGTNNATSEITLINTNPSTDNDWSITPFYNDQTLRFRTNSATTTVMTLKDNGNVGIGTTSPLAKLHISNGGPLPNSVTQSNKNLTISGIDAIIDLLSYDDNTTVATSLGMGRYSQVNGNLIDKWGLVTWYDTGNQGSNLSDRLSVHYGTSETPWGSGEKVSITREGNVGIGTTSPSYKMHIKGDSTWGLGIDSGASQYSVLEFLENGSVKSQIFNNHPDDSLFIRTTVSSSVRFGTNSSERMRIDSSGNVGIGTASPSAQLEIRNNEAGDGVGGATLRLTRGDSTSVAGDPVGTIEFYSTDADTAKVTAYIKSMSEELYGREGSLAFGVSQAINTDATEAMRITNEGNVGIGTTSPIGKLDVSDGTNPLTIDSSTYNEIQSYNRPLLLNRQGNNVGIGNSNPGHKLDVNGSTRVGNYLTFTAGSSIPAAAISYHTNGYLYLKGGGSGIAIGDDSFSSSIYCIDNGNIEFNTQGATKMVINTSGNVGIGTTSPNHKLDIYADSNVPLRIHRQSSSLDTTEPVGIGFSHRGDNNTSTTDTRAGIFSSYNGDLFLSVDAGGRVDDDPIADAALFIEGTNGNVGIGMTTPTQKLEVSTDAQSVAKFVGNTDNGTGWVGAVVEIESNNDARGRGLYLTHRDATDTTDSEWYIGTPYTGDGLSIGNAAYGTTINSATGPAHKDQSKIFINAAGNVGIGTTSPARKLDIKVSTLNDDGIVIRDENGNIRTDFTLAGAAGVREGRIKLFDNSGNANVQIHSDTVSYFNGGNVGIGTTSPAKKLEVDGTVHLGSSGNDVSIGASSSSVIFMLRSGYNYIQASDASGALMFRTGGANNRMIIDSSGNVGIGTTSPSYPLEISGTSTVSLAYQRTGVSAKKWGFHSDNSNTYWQNLTDNILALTLSNAGNVGIGTTSPGAKLDVVGNIKVSGTGTFTGTESITIKPDFGTSNSQIFASGGLYIDTGVSGNIRLSAGGATPVVIDVGGTTTIPTLTVTNNATASSFIKSGGTSSQFLKADGSVDSNTYLTSASLSNYVTTNTTQTISGPKTFSAQTKFTNGAFAPAEYTTDASGVFTLDLNKQVNELYMNAGNKSISNTISNITGTAGMIITLIISQDATGSRTITSWGTGIEFGDAGAPTLSTGANKMDMLSFYSDGFKLFFMGIQKGFSNYTRQTPI